MDHVAKLLIATPIKQISISTQDISLTLVQKNVYVVVGTIQLKLQGTKGIAGSDIFHAPNRIYFVVLYYFLKPNVLFSEQLKTTHRYPLYLQQIAMIA